MQHWLWLHLSSRTVWYTDQLCIHFSVHASCSRSAPFSSWSLLFAWSSLQRLAICGLAVPYHCCLERQAEYSQQWKYSLPRNCRRNIYYLWSGTSLVPNPILARVLNTVNSIWMSSTNQSIVGWFSFVTTTLRVDAPSSLVAIPTGCCTVVLLTLHYGLVRT